MSRFRGVSPWMIAKMYKTKLELQIIIWLIVGMIVKINKALTVLEATVSSKKNLHINYSTNLK